MERQHEENPDLSIQQGAFLVYIAGIHVPVSSINVSFSIMSFSTATISLPADNNLIKLGEEDRVPVVIFYLDKWYSKKDPVDGVKPTWRLLFDGDITQWSYSRSSSSRHMSVNCISHISVVNAMSIIYLSGKGKSALEARSIGDVESQSVGRFSNLQVLSFFRKGAYGNGDIDRPMDFIKNLLLGMKIGGAPKVLKSVKATLESLNKKELEIEELSSANISSENFKSVREDGDKENETVSASSEFFIKYNHRNKVDKRWIASNIEDVTLISSGSQNSEEGKTYTSTSKNSTEVKDESFKAIMARTTFDGIRAGFSQTTSTNDSFWGLINKFYSKVHYSVIQIPTAQYLHVDGDSVTTKKNSIEEKKTDTPVEAVTSHERLANCLSVPNMAFALSPACNVFTPAMVVSFNFSEDYLRQNTRVLLEGNALNPNATESGVNGALFTSSMRFGYPADQNTVMQDETKIKRSPENILIYPEEYFKGPVVSRPQAPDYFLTIEQGSLYQRTKEGVKDSGNMLKATNFESQEPATELDAASKVSANAWRQELLYGFSKAFYLENKYSARNGNIELGFNPYVIPGMTFTMLDNDDFDQFHLTGLVTGVNIAMSNAGVATSMAYTAGRTLKEVYEQVFSENTFGPDGGIKDRDNIVEGSQIYTTAPIMPIRSLSDNLQTDAKAATFYKSLLYSKDEVADEKKRPLVYRHTQYFESTSGDSLVTESIKPSLAAKLRGKVFPGTISKVVQDTSVEGQDQIRKFDLELKILEKQKKNLNDYEWGMRRAARPICSIDEYINMFNITSDQTVVRSNYETHEEFGLEYPVKLRVYVVNTDELGDNFIRPFAKPDGTFSENSSELRRDWPSKLLEYRKRVKENAILGR